MGQCNEWFTSRERFRAIVISRNAVNRIMRLRFLFADDAKLFLQSGIDSVKQWSDHWLLKLNISQCKIVSFGRHVDKNYVYNIKENNQIIPLEFEERYKDLGVTADEKLTFRDHIHDKVNHKAYAMLGLIKTLNTLVLTIVLYSIKVWLDHSWIIVYEYLIKRRHRGIRESSEEGNQDYS